MIWLIICISIVISLSSLIVAGHCLVCFNRFNESIKDWANELDKSTRDAINFSARSILHELDEKITQSKLNDIKNDEES